MNVRRCLIRATLMALTMGITLPAMANHYVYYDPGVYYEPDAKMYYWRDRGNWRSGATLDRHHRAYVRGNGFAIELDTSRPYERHDFVVQRYRESRRSHHHHH